MQVRKLQRDIEASEKARQQAESQVQTLTDQLAQRDAEVTKLKGMAKTRRRAAQRATRSRSGKSRISTDADAPPLRGIGGSFGDVAHQGLAVGSDKKTATDLTTKRRPCLRSWLSCNRCRAQTAAGTVCNYAASRSCWYIA